MPLAEWSRLLPHDCTVLAHDTRIGRWSVAQLASAFGTPLYVYDAATLRRSACEVTEAFARFDARVSFAAKACSTLGVLRCFRLCGLDIDVVSEGEMVAALRAGFLPAQIHLHGNCKSDRELRMAVLEQIRAVVADSADELERLSAVSEELQRGVGVMVRVSLPLEAETHPWLRTSGARTKFGIEAESAEEVRAIAILRGHPRLQFAGVHTHLGSQITDAEIYRRAARLMTDAVARFTHAGLASSEMSLGGGWGVPYTPADPGLSPTTVADAIGGELSALHGVRLAVEPGRALVARAALAVYEVGAVKRAQSGRIVAVNGGMGDNPRPALYGAAYSAFVPNRPLDCGIGPADVVGRYCESGDILAREVDLPEVDRGDLVAVPMSGAYQVAMSSTYNLVPGPAVVLVDGRDVRLLSRRPDISDLLHREVGYGDAGLSD